MVGSVGLGVFFVGICYSVQHIQAYTVVVVRFRARVRVCEHHDNALEAADFFRMSKMSLLTYTSSVEYWSKQTLGGGRGDRVVR